MRRFGPFGKGMHGDRWFWVEENEFGKRPEGSREQPRWAPAVMVGCTEAATAALNTFTLHVDKGAKDNLKFLIDTGATLSLIDEQVVTRLGFDINKLDKGDRLMSPGGGLNSKRLKLPKLTLFGKDFSNFNVNVIKFPFQTLFVVEGIIGMDFLLRFKTLKFDFVQKTIETDSE